MNLLSWLILSSLAAVCVLLALWDEELDPAARAWLDQRAVTVPAEENGYFVLLGLFAGETDDAHAVGRRRVQSYELAREGASRWTEPDLTDYPLGERLDVGTELDSLCKVEKRSCLQSYTARAGNIRALGQRHETLLERYEALKSYHRFVSTATPGPHEPMPDAALLTRTHRLYLADLAVEFTTGSRLRAMQRLADDLRFQRRLLGAADQVVVKMLAAEMVVRDLHLYSEFLDSPFFLHRHLPGLEEELRTMTAAERSMSQAIRREFKALAALLLTVPSAASLGLDVNLPQWMVVVLYKPHATVNRVFAHYLKQLELAEMERRALAESWLAPAAIRSNRLAQMLNPVGSVLAEVSAPDLKRYIGRVNDCEGLLRLVRLKRDIRATGVEIAGIPAFLDEHRDWLGDPYEGLPMQWDRTRQRLFFHGLSRLDHLMELEVATLER